MAQDDTAKLAAEAYERAEAALEAAQEALKQAQHKVEDGLDDAHQYLKRQWTERPLAVAGAALGVGLLVGLLLSNRR